MAANVASTVSSSSSSREPAQTQIEIDFKHLENIDSTVPSSTFEKDGIEVTAPEVSESDASGSSNPFSDPTVAAHFAELYEKSKYECRHEFDPSFSWTPQEERKLVWKLDWHACLWAVSQLYSAIRDKQISHLTEITRSSA